MKKAIHILLISLFAVLVLSWDQSALAAVTVTAATGGTNISADKAANATSPAWTALGNIVITEGANGDFATGTGVTFILTAPAGWQFNTPGSVSTTVTGGTGGNQNVAVTNTSVTASTITLTLSIGGTNKTDILTIIGVQVQPIDGGNLPGSGNILRTSANPGTATVTGITNGTTNFGSLSQVVGNLSQLVVTLPGQTFTDASTKAASGNSGTITAPTAGAAFDLAKLTATDQFVNIIASYSGAKTISYTGPGGTNQTYTTSVSFTSGQSTTTLSTTLYKAESVAITASDGTITGPASSALTVNPAAFAKMQLLVPGEAADPGTPTGIGKTGTPNATTAGSSFSITANAVDTYWNTVTTITDLIGITSDDANAVLPANANLIAGTKAFSVTLKTSGSKKITASDLTDGVKTANTSPTITVNPGAFSKLQILLPNQTAAPGSAQGWTGFTTARNAGESFNLVVNAVDDHWNVITSVSHVVGITSTDAYAILPANTALSLGTVTLSVTLKSTQYPTLTATDISDGTKTPATTASITVNAGAFTKLQILLPGESSVPGSSSGKTGTVTPQTAGTSFNVTVNAVDTYWNLVNTITDAVGITSSDLNAVLPSNAALVSGTNQYAVTLKAGGSTTTITATDITDGAKTAAVSSYETVNAGTFTKLQLLVPGESAAAGSTSGKTGSPISQTVNSSFNATVNAVDAYWNVVNSTDVVQFTASCAATLPPNTALAAGTKTLSVILNATGSQTIAVSDVTNSGMTPSTSGSITVIAGAVGTVTAATGGGAVSADNTGVTYTSLTGPVYQEGATGQVTTGTLVLNVPSGYIFDTGGTQPTVSVGHVSGTGSDITISAVTTTSTQISFTVNSSSTSSVINSLTWQNIRIRPTAGTPLASGNITSSGTSTLVGVSHGSTNFGTLTETAGATVKLVVTLPNQTFTAGVGVSGTPTAQTASAAFNIVSLTATDQFFNVTTSYSGSKTISYSGPGGSPTYTTAVSFTNGQSTTTLATTLLMAEATTITAGDGSISGPASSSLTINAGSPIKLLLLVPGETANAGTTGNGKTGTASQPTAGASFDVTINAVDTYWNVANSSHVVSITSTDANATMPANKALSSGSTVFSVTLPTLQSTTLTVTDITTGLAFSSSPALTVVAGTFTKLQILMPGETAAPGTTNGKTGTPTAQSAVTAFNVTVNAVDANWNVIPTATDVVGITSSDLNATLPANAALSSGTHTFSVTLRTAGTSTVTSMDITDGGKTSNTSPSTTVNTGAFTKLQILVPGETAAPGSTTGKTGTPTASNVGNLFQVDVNSVDASWNPVTATDVVGITSSDGAATLPANAALVGGTQTFNITLNTVGSPTITATDITNGAKTANTSPSITVNAAGTGSVTPATGGSAISADNTGGSWTDITGPVYAEATSGNAGQYNTTIILNAPAGFIFNVIRHRKCQVKRTVKMSGSRVVPCMCTHSQRNPRNAPDHEHQRT
ncbi:MAG: hypothetical protein NTX44_02110 [Ignavibacteriales bacterium]|nr:hypothetical protein [Ignavibacteriales bacterium]